jgi:hypothetical protein
MTREDACIQNDCRLCDKLSKHQMRQYLLTLTTGLATIRHSLQGVVIAKSELEVPRRSGVEVIKLFFFVSDILDK